MNPIPGQEANNANILLKHGVAVKAEHINDVSVLTNELLNSTNKLNQMRSLAKNIGKPRSAIDLAELILQELSKSE